MKKIALILMVLLGLAAPLRAQEQNPPVAPELLAHEIVMSLPNRQQENDATQSAFAKVMDLDVSYVTRDNPDQADQAKAIVERNFDPTAASYIAAYDDKKTQVFIHNFTPDQLQQLIKFYQTSDKSALSPDTQSKLVAVIAGQLAQTWRPFVLTLVRNDINRKIASDLSADGLRVPGELAR